MVGGVAAVSAQGAKFVVQTATMMVLARLLSPEDFGLQGMVVALTGFLGLFRDAGLGSATIQKHEVTDEQTSTLFWINVVIGAVLATLCAALAPLVVRFYHEPRLYWVVVVSGLAFLFNGLAAQHGALLQRGMRFVTQAKIDVLSLAVSSAVGVVMALLGCRYWSLVGMAIANSMVAAAALWIVVPWVPGPPRRRSGIRSMLHFGGLATCNSFVVFLAWNAEKILLGRFWGADALGLYGRAFQLVTLPVQQLNTAVTGVAFPALSRIQHDAKRLARSFLKGYSVLISLTVPVTISCALFPDEIVRIVLGAKWMAAAPIFRLLAPVALVFAVANPLSWLVMSTGRAGQGFEHQHGDNAARDRRNRVGVESRPHRSRLGILAGDDPFDHPDRSLVQTRHGSHLGGSLASQQTTVSLRFARRRGRLTGEAHARWRVVTDTLSAGRACCCFRHLRMGSSDCDGAETCLHGRAIPAIATA